MNLYHFVIDSMVDAYFRASSMSGANRQIQEQYGKYPDFIERVK